MRLHYIGVLVAFYASIANASPVDPGQVEVLDGDTIQVAGETFRLVGFDAPETYRARCASERELGNRATFRVRQLVATGGVDLERVPGIATPPAEAYSVPAKAYPSKRTLNGQRRQQPPALR